jgi:hypothetical protein
MLRFPFCPQTPGKALLLLSRYVPTSRYKLGRPIKASHRLNIGVGCIFIFAAVKMVVNCSFLAQNIFLSVGHVVCYINGVSQRA